ncbi:diguanylate cyclase [Sideroxydans sp. CL21]|uniref:diguanylate cyclase domain-containing protein n=1 Tax=Sideroxydans sp. CL21 TaxID=2600596 RepID=UPI0024BD19AA|nr:diguanylate cyclase [Sideroxydans sp. CL21]
MTDSAKTSVPISGSCARCSMVYFLLTLVYVVSGKLGLMLALPPGYASPIFPPAGIAVAAALIGGRKTLPWIFAGALLLNIWVGYSSNQQINTIGFAAAIAIAVASTLQAGIGDWMLRRVIGYPAALDHGSEILRFILLSPVLCLTSATLSAGSLWLLGSINAANFGSNWTSWWIGDTLGVVVMLPIVMTVAAEPRALWRSRMRTIAVPMLLIFALFVVIFLKANQWEYNDSLSDFRQLSQQAFNQVNTKLEEQDGLLDEMAGLFLHDEHGHVTRQEFHRFVQKALKRFPMIQAVEWVPRVDIESRGSFEIEQRKDLPKFEIRERNTAGQLVRAGEREIFYPVTYIEPLVGNESAVGFDLASNTARHEALTKAIQGENSVSTEAVHLVQDAQSQAGVLIMLAVHSHDNHSGVVLTVLRMDDFMNAILTGMRPLIYTRLVDLDEQKVLYNNFSTESTQVLKNQVFKFGTRHYQLETAPTRAYFEHHRGWQSFAVLTFGILGTGLIGALLLLGTGYTARIEAQVSDRTRKLSESESRFHFILENSPIAIRISANDSGRVIFANQSYANLIGVSSDKVVGVNPRYYYAHPQDYDEIVEQLRKGESISNKLIELRNPNQPSENKWALASFLPLEFEQRQCTLGWFYDITDRKLAEDQIHDLAFYDVLTHLPNRRLFNDRLEQTMIASKRSNRYAALFVLDMDNFKSLNDNFGHMAGDLLLVEVASRLESCVRAMDTVSRFGGDEFVILLKELDVDKAESTSQARLIAEKIRVSLAEPYVLTLKSETDADLVIRHHCTASIGVMVFLDHEESPVHILQWADVAMYQAKDTGKNQIRFYCPTDGPAIQSAGA